jgi:hypothetical protein
MKTLLGPVALICAARICFDQVVEREAFVRFNGTANVEGAEPGAF